MTNLERVLTAAALAAVIAASAAAPALPTATSDAAPTELLRQRIEQLVAVDTVAAREMPYAAPDVLHRFYQSRSFALAWDDSRASALLALIRDAPSHGLDPTDYLVGTLESLAPLATLTGAPRIDADLAFTEALLRYAYHGRFGKVDPRRLDPNWNYARSVSPGGPYAALERILAASDLPAQIREELGHGPMYESTRVLLARYRAHAAAGGWQALPAGPTMKKGIDDPRIVALRTRLIAEGFADASLSTGSTFDAPLEESVRTFQRHHGLTPDGIVGKRTLEELNVSAGDLVNRVRVNLERLRWVLADRTPRFVAVNIAGFRVFYVEDSHIRWSARAVVGKPYRATPVFRADMKYLVLNPDWTVPPTILRRDVLPTMRRDPGYLARQRMDVIDARGRIVDPSTIDWSATATQRFPYMIRQRPGPTNALGRIKFIFPNSHFVFLHDTPSRELFAREERVFSSGCIRVENPLELAEILLRPNPAWSAASLQAAIDSGETRTVFLDQPVPMLMLYLTAIAFEEGADFTFHRDVYNRDAGVLEALDADFVYSPPEGLDTAPMP